MDDELRYEVADGIAEITLARPPVNALTLPLLEAPHLTVIPPGPVTDKVRVEVRLGVPNPSAKAQTAAVEFFRAWLGRDRSRSLDITWHTEDGKHHVSIQGDSIDQSTLQFVAEAASRQLGVLGPWATEPS